MDEPPRDNFNFGLSLVISVMCFVLSLFERKGTESPSRSRYISTLSIGENVHRRRKKYFLISCGRC